MATAEYKKLVYHFNQGTGYYDRIEQPPAFNKLPPDLKVEQTIRAEKIKSKYIIRGRVRNGKYEFFTGLLPTEHSNFYFGDHCEIRNGKKTNSFILFCYTGDKQQITVYYFNRFKLYPKRREKFINEFVNCLKKNNDSEYPTVVNSNYLTGNSQTVQRYINK